MGLGGSRPVASQQPDSVYWAAYFGRVIELRDMLDAGADVNQRESEYRRTPLIATAFKDRWQAALLLLERRAQLEEREESLGCTALMIAAQYNACGVAQALLEAGAEPDAGNDQHGQTALMWCCQYDHAQLASILLRHGASVSKQRKDTVTPLMIAAKNNAYSVAALLLDNGADPNLVGNGRFTALMICAMVDSLDVAQLLLRHGAEKAATNREGKTALILCAENNSLKVAQLLLDTGADADAVCLDNQHSVATVATLRGHLDLLRLLVEHGANYRHRCADGRGLVELAAGSGSQPMVLYARRLIGDSPAVSGVADLHWAAWPEDQPQAKSKQHQQMQHSTPQQALHLEEEAVRRSTGPGLQAEPYIDMDVTEDEVTEDEVTPAHVTPLGPTTFVPFEKQRPDEQTWSEEDAEAMEEPVTATSVRPLGPDTGVSFEQQQLDEQKRAVAEAGMEAETEGSSDSSARDQDSIRAEESAAEAIRAWESLAGLGGSGAGGEEAATSGPMDAGSSETEAEVEEPVTAAHVRPLGPDTGVPFEQQQLDDQKRALETESSLDEPEAVEEVVTATHVQPLGPNTFVPFERQLPEGRGRAEAAESAAAAGSGAISSTTTTTTTRQQTSVRKFPNKKYTKTKKIVTTETTGKLVSKREAIVKISVTCGEVSESVCQTEGPPQTAKWNGRRDTESQFQK